MGCDEALKTFVGIRTYLFRPPRGDWNPTIFREAKESDKHIVLWSVALEHEATPGPAEMAARALNLVRPGAIILMHDGANRSRESTVRALPLLIDGLKAKGYRFDTVPELLNIPGDVPLTSNPKQSASTGSAAG